MDHSKQDEILLGVRLYRRSYLIGSPVVEENLSMMKRTEHHAHNTVHVTRVHSLVCSFHRIQQ